LTPRPRPPKIAARNVGGDPFGPPNAMLQPKLRWAVERSGAARWRAALVALVLAASCLSGQEVDALKRRVSELEQLVVMQKEEFSAKLASLERRLDEQPRDEKDTEIAEKVEELSKRVSGAGRIFCRPVAGSSTPTADVFTALQGGLIFTGLFRTRLEARRDQVDFNSGASGLDDSGIRFNGRFRLGFGAVLKADTDGTGEQITALTEIQSVGTFANNSFLTQPSAAQVPIPQQFNLLIEPFEVVNLYQGYIAFQRLVDDTINVKVGRQELVFGNEMLLGNNSFQEGTVHDALLLQWRPVKELDVSAFYAKEAAADASLGGFRLDNDEDEMMGVYATYEPKQSLRFEGYGLYFNGRSGDNDTFITGSTAYMFDGSYRPPIFGHFWTLGARAFMTDIEICNDILSISAEAAYQFGDDDREDAMGVPYDREIGGLCGEILVNYRFDPASDGLKPIATAGYYYAEGGEDIRDGDLGFQPLFINRHFESTLRNERGDIYKPYYPGGGRYGNMDELPLFNVHILKAALSVAVTERVEVGAGYLYAITARDEGYGTGTFGQEIDVFGAYTYSDHVQFLANFSVFFPGRTAHDLSNLLFFDPAVPNRQPDNDPAFAIYLQALIQF
jgi:hypothetical protein